MHICIGFIIEAQTKEDAQAMAESALDMLCERKVFDYGSPTRWKDDDGREHAEVERVADPGIEEAIHGAFAMMLKDRARRFKDILAKSKTAKFLDDRDTLYKFYKIGEYEGSDVYLYNEYGSGLRTSGEVEDEIKGTGANPVWYAVYDVHS